jgi:hypothetical protein
MKNFSNRDKREGKIKTGQLGGSFAPFCLYHPPDCCF